MGFTNVVQTVTVSTTVTTLIQTGIAYGQQMNFFMQPQIELNRYRDRQGQVVLYEGDRDPVGWPHGRGKGTLADGMIYEGEWLNGLMHGVGKLMNPVTGDSH